MSRDPHLRLEDVIEACDRLHSHMENMDFAAFDRDLKTQDAVIRVFEIIGEAVKSLPEEWTDKEPEIRGVRSPVSVTSWLMHISQSTPAWFGPPRLKRHPCSRRHACAC